MWRRPARWALPGSRTGRRMPHETARPGGGRGAAGRAVSARRGRLAADLRSVQGKFRDVADEMCGKEVLTDVIIDKAILIIISSSTKGLWVITRPRRAEFRIMDRSWSAGSETFELLWCGGFRPDRP